MIGGGGLALFERRAEIFRRRGMRIIQTWASFRVKAKRKYKPGYKWRRWNVARKVPAHTVRHIPVTCEVSVLESLEDTARSKHESTTSAPNIKGLFINHVK